MTDTPSPDPAEARAPEREVLEQFREHVQVAIAYTDKIVVESDGYPMLHSAAALRTLLMNAYISGREAQLAALIAERDDAQYARQIVAGQLRADIELRRLEERRADALQAACDQLRQAQADDSGAELRVLVEREEDGQYLASFRTGDGKVAGASEYSTTLVGALANLCADLIKIAEDDSKTARAPLPDARAAEPVGGPVYNTETMEVSCPACKAVMYTMKRAPPRPFKDECAAVLTPPLQPSEDGSPG